MLGPFPHRTHTVANDPSNNPLLLETQFMNDGYISAWSTVWKTKLTVKETKVRIKHILAGKRNFTWNRLELGFPSGDDPGDIEEKGI